MLQFDTLSHENSLWPAFVFLGMDAYDAIRIVTAIKLI